MQVNIGKNRRNHRALRSSLLCLDPPPLLHHARFEPFLDQADDSPVSDPMLDELDHPGMIDRQAGFDPELMQRNPGLAISKMIASANPDVDVLNTDEAAGKITVRDKKTGKVVTMTFDDAKNGKFSFSAQGDDGKTASLEIGAGADKLPSWIPAYPGAKVVGTFAINGNGNHGNGGSFAFSTSDPPAQVMSCYQDKCKGLGINIKMATTTAKGGMILAADEGERRRLQVIVGTESGATKVQVIYGLKK